MQGATRLSSATAAQRLLSGSAHHRRLWLRGCDVRRKDMHFLSLGAIKSNAMFNPNIGNG